MIIIVGLLGILLAYQADQPCTGECFKRKINPEYERDDSEWYNRSGWRRDINRDR